MFGYLKLDETAPKNLSKLYHKNYCYLCRCLGKHYGIKSRFILSYDVALFLIIVTKDDYLESINKVECFNKEVKPVLNDDLSKKIAAFCLLLLAYKCDDDINDNNSFKAKFVKMLFRGKIKRAKKAFPLMDNLLKEYHIKMNELEHTNSSLEEMEITFSNMMVEIAEKCFGLSDESRLKALDYLSKWLYFIDALDDLDDDVRDNTFNYLKKYASSLKELTNEKYNVILNHIAFLNKFKESIEFDDDNNTKIIKRVINYTVSDTNFNVIAKRR